MSATALDSSVLVLNRSFVAVHVVSVRRAFSLLYKECAEVVHVSDGQNFESYDFSGWAELSKMRDKFPPEDGEWVRTVSFAIRVPRIVRLLVYDRLPKRRVKFNRRNLYARDSGKCQYCGRSFPFQELTLDHIIPRHRGGKSSWDNLVCCCVNCNVRKGGRLPVEAGMKLVRQPEMPRRSPVLQVTLLSKKYESWRHFISEAYWSVELKE